MTRQADPIQPLTPSEAKLVAKFNNDPSYTRESLLADLRSHLQIAAEIELATIPIYLYTYYSIHRVPGSFPSDALSRFADKAGAIIMSIATEEMLHLSLASNILFAVGGQVQLYGKSPGPYPTNLPGHQKLGPDEKPLVIPLAKFSEEHLWRFLEIEYPAAADAPPEGSNWKTIGQIYSYIRCIIYCDKLRDEDFQVGAAANQIQPGNYSPNNIDTVYPTSAFNYAKPVPAPVPGSAASVAASANRADSHAGRGQLITIDSKRDALAAIATIDYQGEGFNSSKWDDPSKQELSHYYKFLTLQSELQGYDARHEKLPAKPEPPPPAPTRFSAADLAQIVFNVPDNPVAADYADGDRALANACSALYQYMLILTETIVRVPSQEQKLYFNQALHMSMIWILDKLIRAMRVIQYGANSSYTLAPTFENYDLGKRSGAYRNLVILAQAFIANYGSQSRYSDAVGYVQMFCQLPDVSQYWPDRSPC